MNKHLRLAYIAIFPALVFTLWQPTWAILDPTHWQWLFNYDRGQNFLGWHLFRLDGWHFPLGQSQMGYDPYGYNIIFTDSIPLLALPLKLFHSILPSHFQYTGFWYLFVCYLNFIAALQIFRHFDVEESVRLLMASLLIFYPPFFQYYLAPSLTSHFIFLFALALFFNPSPLAQRGWFVLLAVLSCLIHIYFLPMVLLLALCRPFFQRNAFNKRALKEAALTMVACMVPVLSLMAVLGFFGGYGVASGIVFYQKMHLLAMIDPYLLMEALQITPFANSFLNGSNFITLKEGLRQGVSYQYWGLGWIAIITSAFLWGQSLFDKKRPIILWGMITILTIIALSPEVSVFGTKLFDYKVGWFKSGLDIFRYGGRFFWLASSILMVMALVRLYRLLGKEKFSFVMIAALALQVADVRIVTHLDEQQTESQDLTALLEQVPQKPPFIYVNGFVFDKVNYHIALRSADAAVPVTRFYLARQRIIEGKNVPLSNYWFINKSEQKRQHLLPHLGDSLKKSAWAIVPHYECFDLLSRDRADVAVDFYEWRDFCILTPADAIPSALQSQFDLVRKDPSRQPSINTIFEDCNKECTLVVYSCAQTDLNIQAFPQFLQKMRQLGGHIMERDPFHYYAIIENGQLVRESKDLKNYIKNYKQLAKDGRFIRLYAEPQKPQSYYAQNHEISFDEQKRCSIQMDGYRYGLNIGINFWILRQGKLANHHILRSYE